MATTTLEQELLGFEKRYWQAIKDRDVGATMRLTDEPCFVAGAQGIARIERQAFADMMKGAQYTLHDFTLNSPQVQMLGTDVAIIAYTVHEDLTVEGKPVVVDAADASVWVRRQGGWACALHTESILGDPFGRDRTDAC